MPSRCRRRQRVVQVALQVRTIADIIIAVVFLLLHLLITNCIVSFSPAKSTADELPPSASADFQVRVTIERHHAAPDAR